PTRSAFVRRTRPIRSGASRGPSRSCMRLPELPEEECSGREHHVEDVAVNAPALEPAKLEGEPVEAREERAEQPLRGGIAYPTLEPDAAGEKPDGRLVYAACTEQRIELLGDRLDERCPRVLHATGGRRIAAIPGRSRADLAAAQQGPAPDREGNGRRQQRRANPPDLPEEPAELGDRSLRARSHRL